MRSRVKNWESGIAALSLILLASPAFAEPVHRVHPWTDIFVYPPALVRLIIAGIICYLMALGITGLFGSKGFPPTVARVGCWLGATLWVFWIFFGILKAILQLTPPLYALLLLVCMVVLFGFVLAFTRPRAVH